MNKIRVIDLLNKIANGGIDDLPDAIKYKGKVYGYDGINQNYLRTINYTMDFLIGEDITAMLNDEVEVIEEDKKIEKIETNDIEDDIYIDNISFKYVPIDKFRLTDNEKVVVDKINEIIDKINKGEKE